MCEEERKIIDEEIRPRLVRVEQSLTPMATPVNGEPHVRAARKRSYTEAQIQDRMRIILNGIWGLQYMNDPERLRERAVQALDSDREYDAMDREEQHYSEGPERAYALPDATPHGGIVVDPGLARSTPCIRMELTGRQLVYSKGIIGALDEEHEAIYCTEGYVDHTPSQYQLDRINALSTAATLCSLEAPVIPDPAQEIDAYFTCIGRELKAQGMNA